MTSAGVNSFKSIGEIKQVRMLNTYLTHSNEKIQAENLGVKCSPALFYKVRPLASVHQKHGPKTKMSEIFKLTKK